MQDVIQEVLAAEKRAREMVQSARAEADQSIGLARARCREILNQAHESARSEREAIMEAATAEALREKTERLERAATEIKLGVHLCESAARNYVEAALDCILGRAPDEREHIEP